MNTFEIDANGEEIILSEDKEIIMMEWEKPYMEQSIDFLKPSGDVLEIGFGCGYSATQILKYPIKSYTIIECDDDTIERIKIWKKYYDVPIIIVKGKWEEKLHTLGIFDKIYFDDYPLDINENSTLNEKLLSQRRLILFMDMVIKNHTRVGSQISFYLTGNHEIKLSGETEFFIKKQYLNINTKIPSLCDYRNVKEQKCLIPLITKVKNYDYVAVKKFMYEEIRQHQKGCLLW